MATSKLQEETKNRILLLFNGYRVLENHRPVWMTNEDTGIPLEIDIYLPDFKIGIEVQGRQHIEYVPYFHKTFADFEYQQKRDLIKKELCVKNNIHLYEIFSESDIDNFIYDLRFFNKDLWKTLSDRNTEIKSLPYLAARVFQDIRVYGKDSSRIQSLLKRIQTIADKYNIPTQAIKPDFSIRKIEMTYTGKQLIKIFMPETDGHSYKLERAAILEKNGDKLKVGYLRKGKQYVKEFDLTTGKSLDSSIWELKLDTIPSEIYEAVH